MKKLISFILVFVLTVMSVSAYASQDLSVSVQSDSASQTPVLNESMTDIENALTLIAATGVATGFSKVLTDNISRGDFLVAMMSCFKLNDGAASSAVFADVASTASCAGAVSRAVDLGIISKGRYFRPDDAITFAEATKMLVVALGYALEAESRGGYPYGYYSIACGLDIDSGVIADTNDSLNSAQCSIILANALEAEMRVVDSVIVDNDDIYLKYGSVAVVLEVLYEWYRLEGVVYGNDVTHIYNAANVQSEGFILVEDMSFKCDIPVVLGSFIEGYATVDGSNREIKYIKSTSDKVITLYPENEAEYLSGKVTYINDAGVEKQISLSGDFAIVYNGKAIYDFNPNDLKMTVGKVQLVNSDDDNVYDVLIIYNGDIGYADIVNSDNKSAVDRFTGNVYDLSDEEKYFVYSDDVRATASAIAPGTAFEVYASKDGSHVELHVLSDTVSGTIQERGTDTLVIDGVARKYTDYFSSRCSTVAAIGTSHTFILSRSGALAVATEDTVTSNSLGYVYRYKLGSGLSSEFKMLIFTQNGENLTLTAADKVKINDSSSVLAGQLESMFAKYADGTLVRYALNADGEVSGLWFPDEAASTQEDSVYSVTSDDKNAIKPYVIEGIDPAASVYYKSFGVFVPYFSIDANTIIFCIDTTPDVSDEDKFNIGSLSSWQNDQQLTIGGVQAYNVTSANRANILVVKAAATNAIDDDGAVGGVVESVTRSFNELDEESLKIVVCYGNQYTTLYLEKSDENYAAAVDTAAKTDIAVGDYVVFTKDIYNNIISYRKDFDYSEGEISHSADRDNSVLVYYYGTLGTVENTSFSVDVMASSSTAAGSKVAIVQSRDEGCWFIDTQNNRASGISFTQAQSYMEQGYEVLVRTRFASVTQLIIYEKQR